MLMSVVFGDMSSEEVSIVKPIVASENKENKELSETEQQVENMLIEMEKEFKFNTIKAFQAAYDKSLRENMDACEKHSTARTQSKKDELWKKMQMLESEFMKLKAFKDKYEDLLNKCEECEIIVVDSQE